MLRFESIMLLVIGVLLGAALSATSWYADGSFAAYAQSSDGSKDLTELQSEVERLKSIASDQAHAMQDVDYHFTNLWFAAQQKNWPLAQFYLNETRSHLRWAVRIIPVRKDSSGTDVKLQDILEAVENSSLAQIEESLQDKDHNKFVEAYEFTLANCYACHKASDKPYLRPRIPEQPATRIINMDPNATWPQ